MRVRVRVSLKFFLYYFLFFSSFFLFSLRLPFERFVSEFALAHFVALFIMALWGQFVCGLYAIFHLNPATGRHAFHLCRFIGGSRAVKRVFSLLFFFIFIFFFMRIAFASEVPVGGKKSDNAHKKTHIHIDKTMRQRAQMGMRAAKMATLSFLFHFLSLEHSARCLQFIFLCKKLRLDAACVPRSWEKFIKTWSQFKNGLYLFFTLSSSY